MELDNSLLEKIKNTDNDTLKTDIEKIARMMGADEKTVGFYLGDMDRIKKAISNITQKDLDKITSSLGEEKVSEIIENIKSEIN